MVYSHISNLRLLIGVPCFNESTTIQEVIRDTKSQFAETKSTQILVVDDGSKDETASIAKSSGATVLQHHENLGVGASFRTIHTYFLDRDYDFLITVDGDSQFDPQDAKALLLHCLDSGSEFASGSRFLSSSTRINMPTIKRVGNNLMARLVSNLSGYPITDAACGLRVYSRRCLASLNPTGGFTYTQETLLEIADFGHKMTEKAISVKYFEDRKSRVAGNLFKYAFRTFGLIAKTQLRIKPGKFYFSLASFSALVSALFAVVFISNYIQTGQFSPYLFAGFSSGFFAGISILFTQVALITNHQVKTDRYLRTVLMEARLQRHSK